MRGGGGGGVLLNSGGESFQEVREALTAPSVAPEGCGEDAGNDAPTAPKEAEGRTG